jgi:hypothetical protein
MSPDGRRGAGEAGIMVGFLDLPPNRSLVPTCDRIERGAFFDSAGHTAGIHKLQREI